MHNGWFASIVVCVCAGPLLALQDGPYIADLVEYQDVRRVIPRDTSATFSRVVGADADQRAVATTLVDGARTELARVVNRHLRAVRDDPTLEEIYASEARVLRNAREVERQLLVDLRSTLRRDQEERFGAFERAHRRSLLSLVEAQPMPIDLWEFLEATGYDWELDASVKAALETFDRESDLALVRQRLASKAFNENLRRGYVGTEESMARYRDALSELTTANANLRRVQARVVEPVLDALPATLADALVVEVMRASTAAYDRNLADPDRFPVVREVRSLDLAEAQRREVDEALASAKDEALALARWCVREQARYWLLEDEQRTDGRSEPLNVYVAKASALRKSVSGRVLSVLAPEQRLAYDALDVVEPSETSAVNDD